MVPHTVPHFDLKTVVSGPTWKTLTVRSVGVIRCGNPNDTATSVDHPTPRGMSATAIAKKRSVGQVSGCHIPADTAYTKVQR